MAAWKECQWDYIAPGTVKAQRLVPSGGHPSRTARHHPPRSLARRAAPDCGHGLAGSLANAAIKAAPSSRCRTAMSGRLRRRWFSSGPFPCPGIAGLLPSRCA